MNNFVTLVRLLRFELNTKEIISVSILEELSIELNNYAEKYIKNIYNKSDSYLIDIVYVKESFLDTEKRINNYYRASLSLAIKEFRELIKQINNDNITLLQEHIISYLFDIRPFINFFEKKQNEDSVLLDGVRNYYTISQEIRLASHSLFWKSIDFRAQKDALAKLLPADKNALVVAYCGGPTCNAYAAAAKAAKELGYTNVKHLSAGISGWKAANAPLEAAK